MSYIHLSSRDRNSGSESQGIIILDYAKRLFGQYRLSEIIFNNNIYGIDNSNNVIYFTDTLPRSYNISIGSYTPAELITEIKSGMESVSPITFTITYNQKTNKIEYSGDASFNFTFETNTLNSSYKLLGFEQEDYPSSTDIISVNPIELNKHRIIYFSIPEAGQNMHLSNGIETTFAISENSGLGEVLRENFNDQEIYLSFTNKTNINYKIHDENGNLINLNNSDWDLFLVSQ
ncbi:MAG: hypothetical protein GY756_27805 [bacterium]|nr:hypothetical protein [bacterium]